MISLQEILSATLSSRLYILSLHTLIHSILESYSSSSLARKSQKIISVNSRINIQNELLADSLLLTGNRTISHCPGYFFLFANETYCARRSPNGG